MANYTLTTSAQEVGRNTSPTVGARLLAWYSNASGNSAIVHLKLQAISQGLTYTGTNKDYELYLDNTGTGVVSWSYAPLPADTWVDVAEITQYVSGGSTVWVSGKVWTYLYDDAWITGNTVTMPTLSTAPTGLSISNLTPGVESFSATVSITGWGTNPGTNRYRELQCWTKGFVEPRRYRADVSNELTGPITVDNASSGSLTIVGNTEYTIGAWATNGNAYTGSVNMGNAVTLAYPANLQPAITSDTAATIYYYTKADGGKYTKTYEYSLDGGTTWTTFATVSSGSASSGSFDLTGLALDTPYTIKHRVTTTAGTNNGNDITFSIPTKRKFYGSANSQAELVSQIYGSSNDEAMTIGKIYGSVDGQSKLIFQGFRHNDYTPGVSHYGKVYYKPQSTSPDSSIQSVDIGSEAEFNSLCNGNYSWTATFGNGSVTVSSSGSNIIVGVEIGDLITSIGDWFLYGCSGLSMPIVVPGNILTIGNSFVRDTSFNQTLTIESGVTSIGHYFLSENYSFNQPLTIPNSVTTIGDSFLEESDDFNSTLTLSSNLTSIGDSFLQMCTSFNQPLSLPNSVLNIGSYFMYYCMVFNKTITLPSSLTTIGDYFMDTCVAFNKSISLPSTLTSIGANFMSSCDNMSSTVNVGSLNASIATSSNSTFSASSSSATAYRIGIAIGGANRATWLSRFPNRTSSPLRKLIDAGS